MCVAEPPSEPGIMYNSSSLCFSTNSSIEVSIDYVISSREPDISKNLSGQNRCIDNPFPDDCRKFNVTVMASNALGTAQHIENFTSNGCDGGGGGIVPYVMKPCLV